MHMGRSIMPTFLACIGVRRSVVTTLAACVVTGRRLRVIKRILSIAIVVTRWVAPMAVWGFTVGLGWLGFSSVASLHMAAMYTLCLGSIYWCIAAAWLVATTWLVGATWLMLISRLVLLPSIIIAH
jgi:hypothetical protein